MFCSKSVLHLEKTTLKECLFLKIIRRQIIPAALNSRPPIIFSALRVSTPQVISRNPNFRPQKAHEHFRHVSSQVIGGMYVHSVRCLDCSEDKHSSIVLGYLTSAYQRNSLDICTSAQWLHFRAKLNVVFEPRNGRV